MKPAMFLAVIAGGVTGTFTFQMFGAGLKAAASPGSIIAILAMTPKGSYLGVLAGVAAGAVVIGNLFTKPISRNTANERTLADAYEIDSMTELLKVTKEVEKVIVSVGSLTNRYQIASDRLAMYGRMCSDEGQLDKIVELADGQHKPKHPLALQGDHWTLVPWTFDWENPPKSRRKKKVVEADE